MNIEIWTRPDCSFCTRAKKALFTHNINFIEKKLDVDFTKQILTETYPKAKTFPIVVVDGFYIGGFAELNKRLNEEFSDNRQLLNE
jgi:glutaredoxin 3